MTLSEAQAAHGETLLVLHKALDQLTFLRELQVTYEVAANDQWVCRACGAADVFANTVKHHHGCRLQKILGGEMECK